MTLAYDYERPARFLTRVGSDDERTEGTFVSSLESPPTDPQQVLSLVNDNDLTHGDILHFGDEDRDVFSVIVVRQSSDAFVLIRNPDDAAAGYLTIPRQVTESVKDCKRKYASIIEDAPFINFHLTGNDVFVKDILGEEAPVTWDYDLPFMWGEPEGAIYITPPGRRTGEFFLRDLTWEKVNAHFQ